jgi:hypothetical protein
VSANFHALNTAWRITSKRCHFYVCSNSIFSSLVGTHPTCHCYFSQKPNTIFELLSFILYPKDQFGNAHSTFFSLKILQNHMLSWMLMKMATQVDEINAYSFLYPVELPGKKFSFKWYVGSLQYNLAAYILLRCILSFVNFLTSPGALGQCLVT